MSARNSTGHSSTGPAIGPYRLHHELGEGTFGKVYLATDPTDDRLVVVKAALRHDPLVAASVRQEFMVASRLRHPHLGETLDHGITALGRPYLVLAYHAGTPLSAHPRPLGEGAIARLGVQIARALAAIHAEGMVHRDVTPANVLVDESGHARLIDLGMVAPAPLSTHGGHGTPLYMAPEALRGEPVDARADLYGLGVVLYELASGLAPFEEREPAELVRAALDEMPTPLASAAPQVGPTLSGLVMRLLAKEPRDRPDSAQEVARALARLATDPVPWTPGPGPFFPAPAYAEWLAEGASPGVEAFVGEPGLGRSRCLREAHAHLRRLNAPAVLLAGEPGEGPYGLVERLWRWAQAQAPDALDSVPRPLRATIAALWPWAFPDVVPADDGQRLARVLPPVLALLLRRAATGGPLAILIDDWEHVDAASQSLLMAGWDQTLREFHWLLGAGEPVKGALTRPLLPFDAPRAQAWVSAVAESDSATALAAHLFEASSGNPGWMAQALAHMAQTGSLGRGTAELPGVPASVEAMLESTWGRLNRDQRALAEALAVLASPVTQGELEGFAGQLPATWPLELVGLVTRGVLASEGGRFRFAHGWWSGWLGQRLAPARRRRLASELGRALELRQGVTGLEVGLDAALAHRIATLYAQGEQPEALVKWASAAGRAAALIWANGLALGHFDAGLAAVAAHPEPWRFRAQAQAMRVGRADVQRVVGALAAACEAYAAAADEAATAAEKLRILVSLGKCRQMQGAYDAAAEVLEAALALAPEADAPVEHVRALSTLGRVRYMQNDLAGSRAAYEGALTLARTHGFAGYVADALSFLGTLLAGQGETASLGLTYLAEALAIREAEDDPLGRLDTHMLLGNATMGLGRYREARAHFESNRELAVEVGYRQEEALALLNLGLCDMAQGHGRAALERLEASLALARETGYAFLIGIARYAESVARLEAGDVAAMHVALTEARECEAALGNAYLRQYGLVYEAERHLFLGAFDQAQRAATLAIAAIDKAGGGELSLKARLLLAEARLLGGELEAGEIALGEASTLAQALDAAGPLAQVAWLAGWLAFRRERLGDARRAWEDALARARAEGLDGLEARVVLALHLVARREGADEALEAEALSQVLARAEAERDPEILALASLSLAVVQHARGEVLTAERLSRRGQDLLARFTAAVGSTAARQAFLAHPIRAPFTQIEALMEARLAVRRERRLEMLLELTRALGASRHPDAALARVQAFTREVTQAERCVVLLTGANGALSPWGTGPAEPYSTSIVGRVFATRASLCVLDTRAGDGLDVQASIADLQLRSVMCVPLLVDTALHGVLYVDSRVLMGAFGPDDLRMVEAIAGQAAVALDNARLFQRMRQQNEQLQAQLRMLDEKDSALSALRDYDAVRTAAFEAESHDLRAPLGAIVASCQGLLKGLEGPLPESQAAVVDGVLLAARTLTRKIDGILDGAGVQVGKLTLRLQDMALERIASEVVRGLSPSAEAKGIGLRLDAAAFATLSTIRADERRVGQMIQNLVDNAIKYTDVGEVVVTADEDEVVRLIVVDTGPGFSPERLAAPFERFGARTARVPGSGVGLWRVKGLMDQHGGDVAIAARPEGGTAVALVFPRWPSMS